MQIGRVVGTTTSSVRHESLAGRKLLVVQLLLADGKGADGEPVVAVDGLGAGPRQRVLLTSDGRAVRELLENDVSPVRYAVIGIVDQ